LVQVGDTDRSITHPADQVLPDVFGQIVPSRDFGH
jgi:hypothetical protein